MSKLLTAPRTVLRMQYNLAKRPLSLAGRVADRFVRDDDDRRLGVEEALGRVQEQAGILLGDDTEAARGQARRTKVAKVREARQHELVAERKRQEARERRVEGEQVAAKERSRALQERSQRKTAATRQEQQGRAKVRQATKAKREQALAQVRADAERQERKVDQSAAQAEQAIEARVDAAREEFQAELGEAAGELRESRDARQRADTLEEIATEEQAARKSG